MVQITAEVFESFSIMRSLVSPAPKPTKSPGSSRFTFPPIQIDGVPETTRNSSSLSVWWCGGEARLAGG